MRFNLLVVCLAGLFLCNVSPAVADENAAPVKPPPASSAKSGKKGVEKVLAGPVVSVNIDKKEISVERNGKQYQISVDGSTRIMSGREPVTLDGIKAGNAVVIKYLRNPDGSRIALTIEDKSMSPVASNKSSKKTEVKAEPKKEESVVKKPEVKAEAAPAVPKAEPKKETPAATKAEAKGEPESRAPSGSKTEAKTEPKKDAAAKDSLAAARTVKSKN